MSIDLTKFHATFFSESVDQLEQAESHLLELERDPANSTSIQAVFRAVHSVKGSAGTLGFETITAFAHEFENLLDLLRSDHHAIGEETIGLCYAGLDLVLALVCDARDQNGGIDESRIAGLRNRIEACVLSGTSQNQSEIAGTHGRPKNAATDSTSSGETSFDWIIQFSPNSDFCTSGNDPFLYLRELTQIGVAQVVLNTSRLVELNELDPTQAYLSWTIYLQTIKSEAEIRSIFEWVTDLCDFDVIASKCDYTVIAPSVEVHDNNAADLIKSDVPLASVDRRKATIHVRVDRLDFLINQIGEITIAQSMFKRSLGIATQAQEIQADMTRLERQLRELQDTVLGLRMLPLRVLFGRFERTIRDAFTELGKRVEFDVSGEDTELDKTMIEKLADPLTHLVRNALDHGIESSDVRVQLGKKADGRLSLSAHQEGNSIVLVVSDDGAGLNTANIKSKAILKGFAGPDDLLSDSQWQQFIFSPGFSTASTVNKWSGRGVGLDAVRESMNALGGDVSVFSKLGEGTQFTLRLPLTMAIVDALLVQSGGSTYAIGLNFVKEYLRPNALLFVDVSDQRQACLLRGQHINAMSLEQFMARKRMGSQPASAHILIEASNQQLVLGVDHVIGQEQIVVRSLDQHAVRPEWASGGTILSDGAVALILDPAALVRIANAAEVESSNAQKLKRQSEPEHV